MTTYVMVFMAAWAVGYAWGFKVRQVYRAMLAA